jgi:hypothetical protein
MGVFDGIISAIGDIPKTTYSSLAGGLIGGVGSYLGQQSANQANAAQSKAQMDFQERMRETSYQTAVEDMKKAGLNPMLAYQQGGAGNQPGAAAQMQNAVGAGVSSAQEGISKYQQLQNMTSQQELLHSQIDDTNAAAALKRATAITEAYRPGLTQAQTNNILKQAGLFLAHTSLASAYEAKSKQDYNIKMPEEAMSKTYYGQIRPYVQDALTGVGQALDFLPKKKSSINIYK